MAGCSGKESVTPSQVVARVNDGEITVHQVNSQITRSGVTGKAEAQEASRKILDTLIEQELLVQQAKENKLDRDPNVMQAMEDAKRRILSQAYLERSVYGRNAPTAEEVRAYYIKHPELFAKRKIYEFHIFLIAKDKFDTGLKSALDGAKRAGEVASILRNQAIDFKEETVQWPAEQMPEELLRTIARISIGDIVPFSRDTQMALMQLQNAVEQPVDENQAHAAIQKFLVNSKNQELLETKLKQLRASAQIAYLGQFAESQPTANTQSPADKEKAPVPKPQTDDYMNKGLSALKK